jgi:hypothetical protein
MWRAPTLVLRNSCQVKEAKKFVIVLQEESHIIVWDTVNFAMFLTLLSLDLFVKPFLVRKH